jgi:hypothetical protein
MFKRILAMAIIVVILVTMLLIWFNVKPVQAQSCDNGFCPQMQDISQSTPIPYRGDALGYFPHPLNGDNTYQLYCPAW